MLLQSANPDVVLKGGLLVRQVPQLHWLDDAIHDQGGPKAGSETQKQHLAAFVTSQSLHGGIVHDLDGTFECSPEVEADPTFSQVPRVRNGPVSYHRSRVAYGYDVILPVRHEFPNPGNHSYWC